MKKAPNIVLGILGIMLLVPSAWEEKAPDFEKILGRDDKNFKKTGKIAIFYVNK